MRYLLDTNICIEAIRGKSRSLIARIIAHEIGAMAISTITLAELEYGVAHSAHIEQNTLALMEFTAPLEVLPFTSAAASSYGPIRAELQRAGQVIGPLDMLIAAHAVALGYTLVTNNIKEFKRVPGLELENWVEIG
jgi:tRNA(fMet)-specific endonuclease VapC